MPPTEGCGTDGYGNLRLPVGMGSVTTCLLLFMGLLALEMPCPKPEEEGKKGEKKESKNPQSRDILYSCVKLTMPDRVEEIGTLAMVIKSGGKKKLKSKIPE